MVLDAAGAAETVNTGIRMARPGGRVILIGISDQPELPLDIHTAMAKELSFQTVKRSNHNAHEAIRLLESGGNWEHIVTHHYPLEQTPAAFETWAAYADGIGKAVIEIA